MISLTGRPATGHYDLIVVSPHMDDAVYSVGGRIALARRQGLRVLVVTLFGPGRRGVEGAEDRPAASQPGRKNAVVADAKASLLDYGARREEERRALTALDVDSLWLDEPELIFRKHSATQILRLLMPIWSLPWSSLHDTLLDTLQQLCDEHLSSRGSIVFPLAVGFHPDHRVACDVGRALQAESAHRVHFYEDIPYNHARPLRGLRLRSLGTPAPVPVLSGTGDITRVLFRASRLLRWGSYLPLASYLLLLTLLQRLLFLRDLQRHEPAPSSESHDIAGAIEEKVAAMQLYPSQTRMFFGEGQLVYEQLRREGYREHSWTFAQGTRQLSGSTARSR